MTWRDVTTYSQSDKGRIPSIWECAMGPVVVVVHRHVHHPGRWLVSCESINVDCGMLRSLDVEDAKAEGVRFVVGRVQRMAEAVRDGLVHGEHPANAKEAK